LQCNSNGRWKGRLWIFIEKGFDSDGCNRTTDLGVMNLTK